MTIGNDRCGGVTAFNPGVTVLRIFALVGADIIRPYMPQTFMFPPRAATWGRPYMPC